jgi:hypothetical protein
MKAKQFYTQLSGVTIISIIGLLLCYYLTPAKPFILLGIIGLLFFIGLSIVIYLLANRIAKSKNLNAFTHLIMYNLMAKLFLSFVIVIAYYYIVNPDERLFILPYILVYLIFTIFEAIFLSRQARQKNV